MKFSSFIQGEVWNVILESGEFLIGLEFFINLLYVHSPVSIKTSHFHVTVIAPSF